MAWEKFDIGKKSTLEKLYKQDRSRKGEVDKEAITIIEAINSKRDYYTTSSCSGRINLFCEAATGKKSESSWLFVKHGTVNGTEISEALKNIPTETVWFKQETPIFHIACRNRESAKKLLEICRNLGFKRAGIIGENERVMMEIIFNDKMDVPIASNGEIFVEPRFIEFLITKANEKFKKNQELLKKFEIDINKRLN